MAVVANSSLLSKLKWCLSCCGLCGTAHLYAYGKVDVSHNAVEFEEEEHRGLSSSHDDTKSKHDQVFTLGLDPEDDEDDLDVSQFLDVSSSPQRHDEAVSLVRKIAFSIQNNDYSQSFDGKLSRTAIKVLFEPCGADGFELLCEQLKETTTSIRSIEFGINDIKSDKKLSQLHSYLKSTKTLETLCIWGNSLDDGAATAIAKALRTNTSLTAVNLNNNDIGDRGLRAFSAVLTVNHTLRSLDLSGNNGIADDGAEAVALALEKNSGLEELNLGSNSITTNGAVKLSLLISDGANSTLKRLDLNSNLITDEGIIALAHAMSKNKAITLLHLYGNIIGANSRQVVRDTLEARGDQAITLDDPNAAQMF